MSSVFGNNIKVSIFGESHGTAIGAVIDGLPAGEEIDGDELAAFMARRAPGNALTTPRKESDTPEFMSGIYKGKTTGAPVCVIIGNTNVRSEDYKKINNIPRPGHADYTARIKYSGNADMRGGGHFSGRLTAPLCAAGGIALQVLKRRGIIINAHIVSIGGLENITEENVKKLIESLDGDSVGGIIECSAVGLPAGLSAGAGGIFGLESALSAAIFGIPAVKGVEFGSGFEGSRKKGSENNDAFVIKDGSVVTATNNHGGLLGGITTGMPLVFRAAFKPTPSIALEQDSIDLVTLESVKLKIEGRHDPCIVMRAAPVVEAVTALVLLDTMHGSPERKQYGFTTNQKRN
ncbi:MAG: chorismate synthase [Oscillospiraceae bacterium]|jgi:chorismate synthase|nr:chorismate synthase [Oscillospiraceae bacterium]